MRTGLLCISFILFSFPTAVFGTYTSYMCEGGIVSAGDNITIVCGKCGNPSGYDHWMETYERRLRAEPDVIHTIYNTHERWTYDLGKGRLIHVMEFENGILKHIYTKGHGSDSPGPAMNICAQDTE